jgi:hypothetical protein
MGNEGWVDLGQESKEPTAKRWGTQIYRHGNTAQWAGHNGSERNLGWIPDTPRNAAFRNDKKPT